MEKECIKYYNGCRANGIMTWLSSIKKIVYKPMDYFIRVLRLDEE